MRKVMWHLIISRATSCITSSAYISFSAYMVVHYIEHCFSTLVLEAHCHVDLVNSLLPAHLIQLTSSLTNPQRHMGVC